MSKPDAAAPDTAALAPAKKSKMRLLLMVGVLLAAVGGGGYWYLRPQGVEAAEAGHEAPAAHAEPAGSLLPLETFTVNLADPGASRFLRVTIQLVLTGEETAAELEHDALMKTRVRSAVLELLTTQQSQTLVTSEGKAALKKDIAAHVTEATHLEVSDVLFSDFVVQF